jgi:hypothetical protein
VVSANTRIVAVEEHFTCQDLLSRIDCATLVRNGRPAPGTAMFQSMFRCTFTRVSRLKAFAPPIMMGFPAMPHSGSPLLGGAGTLKWRSTSCVLPCLVR